MKISENIFFSVLNVECLWWRCMKYFNCIYTIVCEEIIAMIASFVFSLLKVIYFFGYRSMCLIIHK